MIGVKQTQFVAKATGDESVTGNCMAACVASILELSLEDVPNFAAYTNWFERLNEWLKDRNLFYIEFVYNPKDEWITRYAGWHVLVGISPRETEHAVVGYQGKVMHDPHPSDGGLTKIDIIGFFIQIDPKTGDTWSAALERVKKGYVRCTTPCGTNELVLSALPDNVTDSKE